MATAKTLPKAYCPACKRDVEIFVILDKGDEVMNCTNCGRNLTPGLTQKVVEQAKVERGVAPQDAETEAAFLDELAAAMEIEEVLEPVEADIYYDSALGTVLVADDERLVRDIITKIFVDQGVAQDVVHCSNGGEVIKQYNELLSGDAAPIGLIVLDLEMPVLNGLQTALSIRKIEQQKELMPVPILFFSGRKREPRLDEAMKRLRPSMYMYKGEGAPGITPREALEQRVRKVVKLLMQEMNA